MPDSVQIYRQLTEHCAKIADIKHAAAVLQWDQETYLPEGSNEARSRQIATLTETAHRLFVSTKTARLLDALQYAPTLTDPQQRNIALLSYDFEKNKKLPPSFVFKMSRAIHKGFDAWMQARRANNFKEFEKPLQKIIDLKKQEADRLGYEQHVYNALLNDYDKGMQVAHVDAVFENLITQLKPIVQSQANLTDTDRIFENKKFPKEQQWAFGMQLLHDLHFDFSRGRQDISAHPFTTSFGSTDVRLTTRIDEHDPANMIWSCIHELGHGLYEQGLPADEYGMPLGEAASLSVHESQSRLWENCIGKHPAFWTYYYPVLQTYFPRELGDVSLQAFLQSANQVKPSLIRTEADEVTYHFHIFIRYEIEKMLINGACYAKDIPGLWNSLYKTQLDVVVPDDNRGCLQDVHWSHGSFGYFPTYSFGSLMASQLWKQIQLDHPDVENEMEKGNSKTVFQWLQKNIYTFGRYYTTNDLCKKTTHKSLQPDDFMSYITKKTNRL